MNTWLWVAAWFLAAIFAGVGLVKLTQPRERLAENGMDYVTDFSAGQVKGIGALEVLAAVALVLPPLVHALPVLAPLAAAGLVVLMLGATVVHLRRAEPNRIVVTLALLALAGFVAWGRFGPHAF